MSKTVSSALVPYAQASITSQGCAFLSADITKQYMSEEALQAWPAFAQSWNHLGLDRYMADGGRYRKRKYAVFSISTKKTERKPHQPHYQSRDYNPLNGDIERWFSPIEETICRNAAFTYLLELASRTVTALTPIEKRPKSWHTEIHQFRIEANKDHAGQPTPEGAHRDGVDWVFIVMVNRVNIKEGITTILSLQKKPVGSFTLYDPLDIAIVDDNRVFHGVTPIIPEKADQPAYRDVFVMTFRHE